MPKIPGDFEFSAYLRPSYDFVIPFLINVSSAPLTRMTCVHLEFLVNIIFYFISIRKSALDNVLSYRNYDIFTTSSLKESWSLAGSFDFAPLLCRCASGRSVDLASPVLYGDRAFGLILRPIFYSVIFLWSCLTGK